MERKQKKSFVVGITTEGGSVYGIRLAAELLSRGHQVLVVLYLKEEITIETSANTELGQWVANLKKKYGENVRICYEHQIDEARREALFYDGMVIVPCSMELLDAIVHEEENSLILSVAKEYRKQRKELVLVPSQSPFTENHLEQMLFLAKSRVKIVPAMPELNQRPLSLDAMIHFVVGNLLKSLEIE